MSDTEAGVAGAGVRVGVVGGGNCFRPRLRRIGTVHVFRGSDTFASVRSHFSGAAASRSVMDLVTGWQLT